MSLAAIVKAETHETLPDAIKSEYKARDDGTFILDVTPTDDFALENVKGLKSGLSKERAAREAAEKKLKDFGDLDAGKAREALQKMEEMVNWTPDDKVKEQIAAIQKQLEDKHAGEIAKRDDAVSLLTSQLEQVMIDAAAIEAITTHKGSVTLLLPHVRGKARLKSGDSGYSVEIVDDDGTPRISTEAGSSGPMSMGELVAEMKGNDEFSAAFEGSGASGSGASNSAGGKGGNVDMSKWSPSKKLNYAREHTKRKH